jgi:hypothetical protein
MIKNKWLVFVLIGGGVLLVVANQKNIRRTGFNQGIDCIMKGGDRGIDSTPKFCVDYYSNYSKDLQTKIENSPDTRVGKIQKDIWIKNLYDLELLKEDGLSKTFFQAGL